MAKKTLHTSRAAIVIAALGLVILISGVVLPLPTAEASCTPSNSYTVEWGDTLSIIARRFGSTYSALSELNGIQDPNRIFPGQRIAIPLEDSCTHTNAKVSTHIVQRGETLWRIAARYGVSLQVLVDRNGLRNPGVIYVRQSIVIPTTPTTNSNPIFAGLQLSTITPKQGRTFSLSLPVADITNISGKFIGNTFVFFEEDDVLFGLIGVDALDIPGTHELTLEVTTSSGVSHSYSHNLSLREGGYQYEDIVLSAAVTKLISDPVVTANERQLIKDTVAHVTQERYWQGLFQLPSVGRITSHYGTRRSYNGGGYNSYHGGVDFSANNGSKVRAPATGKIVLAQPLHVRGNTTVIDHGLGIYSVLLHQEDVLVSAGEFVTAGQHIGNIGATGLVTGPHLHWEILLGGIQVEPLQWTQSPMLTKR